MQLGTGRRQALRLFAATDTSQPEARAYRQRTREQTAMKIKLSFGGRPEPMMAEAAAECGRYVREFYMLHWFSLLHFFKFYSLIETCV